MQLHNQPITKRCAIFKRICITDTNVKSNEYTFVFLCKYTNRRSCHIHKTFNQKIQVRQQQF